MLTIGQVVYDTANNRVLVFAGLETLQSVKTGKVQTIVAFIDEEGNFSIFNNKDNPVTFRYTNFSKHGKPYAGSTKLSSGGGLFGIIDGDESSMKAMAVEAIQEMKKEMSVHGFTIGEEVVINFPPESKLLKEEVINRNATNNH